MATRQPVNETLNSTEARAHWGRVLGDVHRGDKRVVIERGGVPVAAIISAEELRRFEQWERYQRRRNQLPRPAQSGAPRLAARGF